MYTCYMYGDFPSRVAQVAWAPVGTGAGALLLTGGSDGRVQASKNGEVVGGNKWP